MISDANLIKKYDCSGPRYTSYPTANNFIDFSSSYYKKQVDLSNKRNKPLSIYCHIPFCKMVCYFCGCNKVITKNEDKAIVYLEYLFAEIDLQKKLFFPNRLVEQMHFGGGTPTFLTSKQIISLGKKLADAFNLSDDGEYSIEIDPRWVDENKVKSLIKARFNRISIGVQDFNLAVQQAVNREQSFRQTKQVIDWSRKYGFKSVSIDLIYGLPKQTVKTFADTLNQVAELKPERISLFNYAHIPSLFKPQRRINTTELPAADEKLNIFQYSLDFLLANGYVYIGMDHFALPHDPLAIAQQEGSLYRNFQGYSAHSGCDMLGIGLSAIGQVGDSFSQNTKNINHYYEALSNNVLPIVKGRIIDDDDKIRRAVIMELICNFKLHFVKIENEFNIVFCDYFADNLASLASMATDGLLIIYNNSIVVLTKGKLLIRNICMQFDAYLTIDKDDEVRFSKII